MAVFSRYIAIGDSQTEGLWDGDDATGLAGFADRLATMVDSLTPGLTYANLAVRGKRIRDVLDDQLSRALEMEPDLITVCVGMNDLTRPGTHYFERALADLGDLHAQLAQTGATVVTTTFPDLAQLLPVGRLLASRVVRINDAIRAAAQRPSVRLVDLYGAPSMTESDTWSDDRVHGSAQGHALFAAAAAEALGLPGSNHDWARANDAVRPSFRSRMYSQALWTQTCSCRGFGGTPGADRVGTAGAPTVRSWNAWASYKPKKGSGIGDWPLPIDDTIAGQNMEIAMPVNIVAGPSDMPPTSATFAAASAAV